MDTSFGDADAFPRGKPRNTSQPIDDLDKTGDLTSYRDRPNIWRDKAQYIARPALLASGPPPYLHNGSIPTLYELLSPARRRACFVLDPNMEFDPERWAFVTGDCAGPSQSPTLAPRLEFRTALPGNSNRGTSLQTRRIATAQKQWSLGM